MKTLVTAFKPFLKQDFNVSEQVLQSLKKAQPEIEALVLSVSYEKSIEELKSYWQFLGPFDRVLMLGQAAERTSVCLERVAVNWTESRHPDEDGVVIQGQKILKETPDSYINEVFSGAWLEPLSSLGSVSVSLSAGGYVCNSLYFQALHFLNETKTPALFVHLPLAAAVPLEAQTKILQQLLVQFR